ncbi:MAG: polysaccharide deacetylase family protein [Nannocystaceae bacterium]
MPRKPQAPVAALAPVDGAKTVQTLAALAPVPRPQREIRMPRVQPGSPTTDTGRTSSGIAEVALGPGHARITVHPSPPSAEPAPVRHAARVPDVAVVHQGSRLGDRVALTFDDGPSAKHTPRVLATLRRFGAKATFFVQGRRVQQYPELARRIVDEGHQIANHSFSHASFRSLFKSQIRAELSETQTSVEMATGRVPAMLRPPFGRYPESSLAVFAEFGLNLVLWTVDSGDWHASALEVMRTVVRETEAGSIVLLHDSEPQTVRALPDVLRELEKRGLTMVTVAELTGLPAYAEKGARGDVPAVPVTGDDGGEQVATAGTSAE